MLTRVLKQTQHWQSLPPWITPGTLNLSKNLNTNETVFFRKELPAIKKGLFEQHENTAFIVSERDRLAYQVRLIDSCSIRHILNIYLITATVTYHYFDHFLTGMQVYPTSSSNLSLTQKVNKKYSVRKIPSNKFPTCTSSLTSSATITGAVESSQRIGRPLRCRLSLNRSKEKG